MRKIPLVIIKLIRATIANLISWSGGKETGYTARVGSAYVRIHSKDLDGLAPYAVTINSPGRAEVTIDGDSDDEDYNRKFEELYLSAEASAVDASPAVEDVLAALEKLDEPPF